MAMTVATQIQAVVVAWQIYDLTHDPLSLGLIGLAEAVPFIGVALFAGHVADRVNRLRISPGRTGRLVPLLGGAAGLHPQPGYHHGRPGLADLPGDLLERHRPELPSARALGPGRRAGAAGALSQRGHLAQLHLAVGNRRRPRHRRPGVWLRQRHGGLRHRRSDHGGSAVFFAGADAALAAGERLGLKESFLESLATGIRFVRSQPVILGALTLDLFSVLFGGAVALLPVFAAEILHVGPEGLGVLRAAPAVGRC